LTSGLAERLEIVVRFLAVLELFKQGAVDLEQVESFGEITIVWLGGGFDPLSASSQLLADAETYD
jgi:segregation and condensation protein A